MERQKVVSSNIESVGYNESGKVLEVKFTNGKVYQYFDVPKAIHEGLMKSESKGRYFKSNVRSGTFQYKRIEEVKKDEEVKHDESGISKTPSPEVKESNQ